MAFDGLTIRALTRELNTTLAGGYIRKIIQPEKEELLISVKTTDSLKRLFISANASLPLIYLIEINKKAPQNAPNFCMLLRKHIGSGKIRTIEQIGNDRVIKITIDHKNELGDDAIKSLYVEIMGKHSNIIFCDENDNIIDGIKHVSFNTSSVREILPGRTYFIPEQDGKTNPYEESCENFCQVIADAHKKLNNAIVSKYTGISKTTANEVAYRTGLDGDYNTDAYSVTDRQKLFSSFNSLLNDIDESDGGYIAYDKNKNTPIEYAPYALSIYADSEVVHFTSVSEMLYTFYDSKNRTNNIHQKSTDLRKLVATFIERTQKKYNLQKKQLSDTNDADKYRVYGTLLQTYPGEVTPSMDKVILNNYENGEDITIPLDKEKNAIDNAKRYFDKYAKLKRTRDALETQTKETYDSLTHLASIQNSLLIAETEADLADIRLELYNAGYIKSKASKGRKKTEKSKPLHFVTDDGFHIYVGKNNFQNDELTFKMASGEDYWFHAKQIPGSHVIVKREGRELPDRVYEICAELAGYYSSGRESEKLEIDYVNKKEIKKPSKANPGFVVYYTNYSMTIHPAIPKDVTIIE